MPRSNSRILPAYRLQMLIHRMVLEFGRGTQGSGRKYYRLRKVLDNQIKLRAEEELKSEPVRWVEPAGGRV